ncbi:MAG TPA: TetR/AcrR family transcriptional regulator [Polyangiaceae bacterium]
MFKSTQRRGTKGETTRQQLLEAALQLFSKRGFERTTMRAIAKQAGLSLGAAYHYFDSKDAILTSYYEWLQDEHERLMAAIPSNSGLRERIAALFETKLAIVRKDRRLLAALFSKLGDPSDPLSVFGKKNAALRDRSIRLFASAVSGVPLPADTKDLTGRLLWLAHLAVLLFFVHDRSPRQTKTQDLVTMIVDFAVAAAPWLGHPQTEAVRQRLLTLAASFVPSGRPS